MEIRHEGTERGGRFFLDKGPNLSKRGDGALEYALPEPRLLVIEHTFVPIERRGQGIAAALVEQAVAYARQMGWRVEPRCSFAAAQFARHPEYRDLVRG